MDKITVIRNWLKKAEHDLGMAKLALESGPEFTDSICFHCQQCAERMLKGYLTCLDIGFIYCFFITISLWSILF